MRPLLLYLLLLPLAGCAAHMKVTGADGDRRFCLGVDCYQLGRLGPAWLLVQGQTSGMGYYNAALGSVIQTSATCREDLDAAPLQSLTDHLLVGYTARTERSAQVAPLGDREARRTVVDVKLDGVPMVLDLYVFKRNGCVFDLSYAAPPGDYARGLLDFERFVADFTPSRSAAKGASHPVSAR